MKITILSKFASCLDLAMKLQEEGNEVTMHIMEPNDADIGLGLIETTDKPGGVDADLIINDDVFMGNVSDKLRKIGKAVLGGSTITDRLENDRFFGTSIMKACGIKTPKAETFDNFEDAIAFIKVNEDQKYMFKPHGQQERFWTFGARNADEMVILLEHYAKKWGEEPIAFDLQEFIDGIEMAIGGWFNGTKFCRQVLPNFEHKKLMTNEIGPNTGEMGTVMAYRTHSKLYQETLSKAEAFLKTTGFRGFLDLACIVTEDIAYGLEWTARFGYPTLQIQDEVHKDGTWTDFLFGLATGTIDDTPADTSKWCVGVAMCTLPWPLKSTTEVFKDTPVFLPEDKTHIHLDCMKFEDGQFRQAGHMGYLCLVTGADVTIERAQKKAYKVVKEIDAPSLFYRIDIGDKVIKNMPTLKSWGWIR